MLLIAHWFRAFVWTLLLEQVAAGRVLRQALPSMSRRVSIITLVNLASHPAVWLIFPELGAGLRVSHLTILLVSEAWAYGLEAWIYWLFLGPGQLRLAVKAAVIANTVSLGLGYGLRFLGWV